MSRYDFIFFDMDGTLTDSAEGIIRSVQYAIRYYRLPMISDTELRAFVGPPLSEMFQEKFGFTREKAVEAIYVFREYFETKGIYENALYEGIPALLKKLTDDGKKLFVVTAKLETQAVRIADYFHIEKYFSGYIGTGVDEKDTKTDVLRKAFTKFNIHDPKKCIMIGDRKQDILAAGANGIDSLGVLYGYGSREELVNAGATRFASSPEEIYDMISGNE